MEIREILRCPQCSGIFYDPIEGSCRWCHWRPLSKSAEQHLENAQRVDRVPRR